MSTLCFPWRGLAGAAVLVLQACTPVVPLSGVCDAARAQGVLGQRATPQQAQTARAQAGARRLRVIGHDDSVTKEYDSSRLNLQLDEGGRVVQVYCG